MTRAPLIVAIDGPSGVGKSTAARLLADRLGLPYLDTGAMYRAITLAVLDAGIDPADRAAVAAVAAAAQLELMLCADGRFEVRLAGETVEPRIRDPRVSDATSRIAAYPEVRSRLVELQRAAAGRHGGVIEGRDIGSRVVPETPFKFFFEADPEVRRQRRREQLALAGKALSEAEEAAEIDLRDARDRGRESSPLAWDQSYELVDTSQLSIAEVVERMVSSVARRGGS